MKAFDVFGRIINQMDLNGCFKLKHIYYCIQIEKHALCVN